MLGLLAGDRGASCRITQKILTQHQIRKFDDLVLELLLANSEVLIFLTEIPDFLSSVTTVLLLAIDLEALLLLGLGRR